MNSNHYSISILWDPRDNIYVASVPELPGVKTHGDTYQEAMQNILEVIDMWVEDAQKHGEALPLPKNYSDIKVSET
jgi:predicted RNase H-like HicB family nuclease